MLSASAFYFRGRCRRMAWVILSLAWLCLPAWAQTSVDRGHKWPLLTPWTTLTGAFVAAQSPFLPAPAHSPEFAGYLSWQMPSAVAARGNYLYVLDAGRRQIFRYDLAMQTMTPFAEYSAGAVTSMAVASDLSLYATDSHARQVLHFSFEGRLLQKFANDFEMTRPVAVLPDERSGNLWVADSLHNHVLLFNSLGRVLAALRPTSARSIEAMASGPDGLYLVDRLSRQIVVIGPDGAERYALGKGTLKMPGAIAVDRFNRVFVSDTFDNVIRVYVQRQLVATVGGSGAVPASFNRITGLSIDHNMLYVADSLNARVQTFQLAPPAHNVSSHD